jgi:hypothetical protein
MTGAGLLVVAIGVVALLYLWLGRAQLRRDTERRRTLPVLGELPLWLHVGVQAAGALLCIALGIWLIASG